MHSSEALQGDGFEVAVEGRATSHADYFRGVTRRDRLALYCPGRIEGLGAINLVMAYVTAFYDDYRATGEAYFAYPDYFALYHAGQTPPAYGMFDIYPDHKTVAVSADRLDVLAAVTDRAANVLLVPDRAGAAKWDAGDDGFTQLAHASAKRTITTCYAYAMDGEVADADMVIACDAKLMVEWAKTLVDSIGDDADAAQRGRAWVDAHAGCARLTQSYRRIGLDEALRYL